MARGKRLVLVRHAKSSWDSPGLPDHQRPLNPRGQRTAPAVAIALVQAGWAPDVVICSNAVRALQTWERMEAEVGPNSFVLEPAFYMGGTREIRDAVRELAEAHQTAWLIGHNPGWELAADVLCAFDGAVKTADCVRMTSDRPTWGAAIAPGNAWHFEGHLAARSVDPKTAD